MRATLVIIISLILFSCGSRKNVDITDESDVAILSDSIPAVRVVGVVAVSEIGCFATIAVSEDGKELIFFAVNLEDRYKVDGMTLKFNYWPSRAQQPPNCNADRVVSISDVSIMRGGG